MYYSGRPDFAHKPSNVCERKTAVVDGINPALGRGLLRYGGQHYFCTLGRGGRRALKREGDGASPVGLWPVREVLYRADRVRRVNTKFPVRPVRPDDAWCDISGDRNYNRAVKLPYPTIDERLWREDHLSDIIVVLGYNDSPRMHEDGAVLIRIS